MFDLFDEFLKVTRSLAESGVPYAVCGGFAVALHGVPRATKDIDLLVPPEHLAGARQAAARVGFTLESLPMRFGSSGVEIQRVTKVAAGHHLTVDLLLVNDATREAWNSRQELATEQGAIWSVSREGLIALKRKAGRPQDVADIARLEELA